MTRDRYFEKARNLYENGEIDEATYDAMCLNADQFCEDAEERTEDEDRYNGEDR